MAQTSSGFYCASILWLLFALATVLTTSVKAEHQCSVTHGNCRTNVHLVQRCGGKRIRLTTRSSSDKMRRMERMFKIYSISSTNKLQRIEQKLSDFKTHRQEEFSCCRQNHLDTSDTLASNKISNYKKAKKSFIKNKTDKELLKDREKNKEERLLDELQLQFSALRKELFDSEERYKKLHKRFRNAQETINVTKQNLKKTVEKLIKTDNKLKQLQNDKESIKTELARVEKIVLEKTRIVAEKDKVIARKNQRITQLTRDNILLKRQLANVRFLLKLAQDQLQNALRKYHELNVKHDATLKLLNETRVDLIVCYKGKTMQYCSFEDPNNCGFRQDKDSDWYNWTKQNLQTPTSGTGPDVDNTCRNERGFYMFAEASKRDAGKNAQMISPRYQGLDDMCVEWFYHMYGNGIGILNVYTRDMKMQIPDKELVPVWRAFGNQGNVWTRARLQVPAEVVFEVQFGAASDGDVAVDDFRVFDGICYPNDKSKKGVKNATINKT